MTENTAALPPTPIAPEVEATRWLAVGSLVALIALCLAWELVLAPVRPGGSWLAIKALPLCIPLAGILKNRMYTYRWVSLVIWLYFTEGVVRAWSDKAPGNWLAMAEIALCLLLFVACTLHVRLRQRNARALESSVTTPDAAAIPRPASEAAQQELPQDRDPSHGAPYLSLGTWQFVLLSLCSFQLYLLYWFFRHWRTVQQRDAIHISPAARALLSPVYCYPLLSRIRHEALFFDYPSFPAGRLAAGYVICGLAGNYFAQFLPGSTPVNDAPTADVLLNAVGWIVFFMPTLFLIPAQQAVNHVNASLLPDAPVPKNMTPIQWCFLALSAPFTAYAVYSSFAA